MRHNFVRILWAAILQWLADACYFVKSNKKRGNIYWETGQKIKSPKYRLIVCLKRVNICATFCFGPLYLLKVVMERIKHTYLSKLRKILCYCWRLTHWSWNFLLLMTSLRKHSWRAFLRKNLHSLTSGLTDLWFTDYQTLWR